MNQNAVAGLAYKIGCGVLILTKILFVVPFYYPNVLGGAEISTQLIAESYHAGEVDILTPGISDNVRYVNNVRVFEKRIDGLSSAWQKMLQGKPYNTKEKILYASLPNIPFRRFVREYYEFFKREKYDTIVFNANSEHNARAAAWKAAHLFGAKTILVLRDPALLKRVTLRVDWSKLLRRVVAKQLQWIDTMISPSQYMLDAYSEFGLCKENSLVIPNTVKTCVNCSTPFKEKRGVIYAGRIEREKGILTLVDALAYSDQDIKLTIVGRGSLFDTVGEHPSVQIIDWMKLEDIYIEMSRHKVLVLPSEYPEAFGRVLIEAVNAGTLVIGSNAGAIPEVLNHDCRYLFDAGNSSELLDKIDRIYSLTESDYNQELADLRAAFEKYSYENYVLNWHEALDHG